MTVPPDSSTTSRTVLLGYEAHLKLMRVLHCTSPMPTGSRVSLNLNLRSRDRPYVDDNPMYYLGADNPDVEWVDHYVADVRHRQLPAYLAPGPR